MIRTGGWRRPNASASTLKKEIGERQRKEIRISRMGHGENWKKGITSSRGKNAVQGYQSPLLRPTPRKEGKKDPRNPIHPRNGIPTESNVPQKNEKRQVEALVLFHLSSGRRTESKLKDLPHPLRE